MKVAHIIAQFLKDEGIGTVFGISGGASLHIIHAITDLGIELIPNQNEQACGFAADAYTRLRGAGCALATSGPGASNLITAIASSYYDSVPTLYITGNQTRSRMTGDSGCRQIGFQETPIVDMVRKITKYAHTTMEPETVLVHLKAAMIRAREGRPGPVLIDVPDDVQRADV